MGDDHKFCGNCGKKVERVAIPPDGRTSSTPELNETPLESVIGGLASADMVRPGSFGYGIYITDRRVIGTKKPDQFIKSVGGAIAGAAIGIVLGFEAPWAVSSALGRSLSDDENIHLLTELEKKKDFEAYNKDITLIQLKSPGLVSLGQLAIFLRGEKTTNIAIAFGKEKVFENLKSMFQTHYLKILKVI